MTALPRTSPELPASMLLLISLDMMTIFTGPACSWLFRLRIVIFLFVDSMIFTSTFAARLLKIKSTLFCYRTIPITSLIFTCPSVLPIFLFSPLPIFFGVSRLTAAGCDNVLFASL